MTLFRNLHEVFRQPDRNPRCYELTEQERTKLVKEWNNRNVWNTTQLAKEDINYNMESK